VNATTLADTAAETAPATRGTDAAERRERIAHDLAGALNEPGF
jgi:hypothetical protein